MGARLSLGGELLKDSDCTRARKLCGRRKLAARRTRGGITTGGLGTTLTASTQSLKRQGGPDIEAARAEVSITTLQGDFTFPLRDVRLADPLDFLGGAVIVDRVPTVEKLTDAGAEDDYPAVLGGTDGSARTAWVAFRDGADVVLTRNFQGGTWGPVETVTESPGDIHVVQLGRAGDGSVWFVWAEQREGNFDLYGRSLKEGSWGSTMRLTEAPQPDVLPNMATTTGGDIWLVWQGFRDASPNLASVIATGSGARQLVSGPRPILEPVSLDGHDNMWDARTGNRRVEAH